MVRSYCYLTSLHQIWSNNLSKSIIKPAELSWEAGIHPHSSYFDDHYYSLVNGLEETRHVFIEGNNLASRWSNLAKGQEFYIMETGFGSGLNFLATWQLWNNLNIDKSNKLHFISVEAFPMNRQQLEKSLLNWKETLGDLSALLLEKYPNLTKGSHRLFFENDTICLTLVFSDVREFMPTFKNKDQLAIDAWYLDGFSPAINPEMWQKDLYSHMFRLSKGSSTVATYTVAGVVRRGLTEAGFSIKRASGFGTKREMLTAKKLS